MYEDKFQSLTKRFPVQTQKKSSKHQASPDGEKPSCWSRLNCFKCCKPCCSKVCGCSSCCRKKDTSTDSLQSDGKVKDNETPGTCTRFFCFCCLCCRKKPEGEMMEDKKKMSMASQKQGLVFIWIEFSRKIFINLKTNFSIKNQGTAAHECAQQFSAVVARNRRTAVERACWARSKVSHQQFHRPR